MMDWEISKDVISEWNLLIFQLAGEVEVGFKWQYLHAARDFLGHAEVLLPSFVESLRKSVVDGYVKAV